MRDSLDLDDLQRQSASMLRLRALLTRSQSWSGTSFLVLLIALILASHLSAIRPWFENASQFVIIGVALTIHPLLVYFVLSGVIGIRGIDRVKRYKPDFVRSADWSDLIIKWLTLSYQGGCLIVLHYVIYTRSYLFIFVMLLLLLPEIWDNRYRRFYRWVVENEPESLKRLTFLIPYHYPLTGFQLISQFHKGAYSEVVEAQRAMLSGRYSLHWICISVELNNYACSLIELGRYEEALPLLESSIRINPTAIPLYHSLVFYYFSQKIELDRAMQLIDYILHHTNKESPSYALALSQQAYIAALLKRPEQAQESLILAQNYLAEKMPTIRYRPPFAEIYYRLGETARILEDSIHAHLLYDYAIKTAPDTIYAQRAREQVAKILT